MAIETKVSVEFMLHEKQQAAIESPATEILYGGAAGGGKSHLMRVAAIIWCLRIPGLQCYLYRRSYKELTKNHMRGPTGFPALLAAMRAQGLVRITQKEITFWNGSVISLNHLQYSKNLTDYQGPDIHVLLMDELTHFTESEYTYLRGRLRIPEKETMLPPELIDQFPRALNGSNPGGIGHHWVKKYFIQRDGEEPLIPMAIYNYRGVKGEGGKMRQFIPARIEDNPALDREDYEETLEGMGDPLLVRALKEGDWNVLPGTVFGPQWRNQMHGRYWHVTHGFPIPLGWPLWRGGDDGYEAPACTIWFTEDPRYKTLYVIDELYKAGMLADEYATRVMERDMEIAMQDMSVNPPRTGFFNTERLRGAMDTSAWGDIGGGHQQGKHITRGDQMNKLGARWERVEKWPRSRVAGIQNFHRLLASNPNAPLLRDQHGNVRKDYNGRDMHDRPGISFFLRCHNCIRTINALPRSKRDMEDISDDAEDHAFDAVRYGIQYRRGRAKLVNVTGL